MKTSQKPETIRQHLTVIKEELSVNFEESSANHSESSLKYYLSWGVLISFIHRLKKESIITDWVGVEGEEFLLVQAARCCVCSANLNSQQLCWTPLFPGRQIKLLDAKTNN